MSPISVGVGVEFKYSRSFWRQSSQPITCWQTEQYRKIHKLNTTQKSKLHKIQQNILHWFSHLLRHSARKQDRLILQHPWAHMMQHPSKSTVQAVSPVSVYLCKLSFSASQILHVHSYTINFFKSEKNCSGDHSTSHGSNYSQSRSRKITKCRNCVNLWPILAIFPVYNTHCNEMIIRMTFELYIRHQDISQKQ